MISTANNTLIYRFFLNLFFIFFISASIFAQKPKSELLQEKTDVTENISYKKDGKGNPILLDIYRPKNSSQKKLPVVIYLHGGAWVEGDKLINADNYIENTILKLVEKDFIVISANYRLVSEAVHFPGPVEDTKDAVRWIRKNADKYSFDSENIGFWEFQQELIYLYSRLTLRITNL